MKAIFSVASALMLASQPVSTLAANWFQVYSHSEFSSYVDLDSIKRNGDIVRYWIHIDYIKIENQIIKVRILQETNCENSEYRSLVFVNYYSDGSNKSTNNKNSDWNVIVPDTIGDVEKKRICSLV